MAGPIFLPAPYLASENGLINSGFAYAQRVLPTAATAMTDDAYDHFDRWYSLVQGANGTVARVAGTDGTDFAAKLVAGGTTNRFGMAQILPSAWSKALRGKTCRFQTRTRGTLNAGAGTVDVRAAVLEWTGTANAVTSELVADWTSSTYTTAGFFASTTKTLVGTTKVAATHNVWTDLAVTGNVSSSCNNLIVFVWWEDVPANAADFLEFCKLGLYRGTQPREWLPKDESDELDACRHYCYSTYNTDIAPATNSVVGARQFTAVLTTDLAGNGWFPVRMRTTPTITIYGTSVGTTSHMRRVSTGADTGAAATATSPGADGFWRVNDTGAPYTVGVEYDCHIVATAEL